ncbi:restriction endonuclease subunit S [Helicobacter sp. UBA3407]|uniref:restriction endonuclease subunit S n=1 Tax=Helicobacter sp. UBA3407 TaxID=1946588 RepID=UPI002629FA7A|nr:restriction endonuclease subunit S [Helicobacter sp. UBA3407]
MSSLFHNLPQGWQVKTLGEVSKVITGKTPPKSHSEYFKGKIPFVKPNDLDKDIFICQSEDTLTELGFKHAPFVPKNSVLVSCIGNLGKKAILEINGSCNQQINAIIPNENLDYKFLYYQMNILRNWLEQNASATTIKIINKSKFEKAPIILPPLETQKAIVQKLENAFAHIDEAVRHLKSVQTNIPRLKSSLLHSAFSGKLIESQNQSHEVQTLKSVVGVEGEFERKEGETSPFKPPHPLIKTEIPQGWEVKTLGEVCEFVYGKALNQTKRKTNGKYPVYAANGIKDYSDEFMISENSIIVGRKGSVGSVVLTSSPCWVLDVAYYVNFDKEKYNLVFLYHLLKYLNLKQFARGVKPGISRSQIYELQVVMPPLATQNQIVQILESKFTHLDNLAQFVNASLENLQKLKSSLLNQAFKGELIC